MGSAPAAPSQAVSLAATVMVTGRAQVRCTADTADCCAATCLDALVQRSPVALSTERRRQAEDDASVGVQRAAMAGAYQAAQF